MMIYVLVSSILLVLPSTRNVKYIRGLKLFGAEANIISIVFWCVLCHVRAMLPFLTVRSTSIVYQETVIRMLEETSEIYLYKFIVQQM